ncbi:MAG: Ig-like domain-containing protein, partial [Burkholderiaceae bacterium]
MTLITRLPDEPAIDTAAGILQGPVAAINAAEAAAGITITGLATPGNTITLSFVTAAGAAYTYSGATSAAGRFAVPVAPGSLPDGQYTLRADASDIAGNLVTGKPVPVLVDTVAPRATAQVTGVIDDQAALTGAVPANGVTNDASPTLTGSLGSALVDGEQVVVVRNGVQAGVATVDNQNWSFTDRDLVDGPYAYSAAVVDAAGNTGPLTGSVFPINVDRTPPAAPTINPVGGNDLVDATEVNNVMVSGSAAAGAAVTLEWAGVTRNLVADAGGNWSTAFGRAPTEGRSDIRVTVSDAAGNSATTVRTVIVDTTPPPPPSINPVEGDDVVNASEAANRIDIGGRAEGGSRIDVNWGGQGRTTTANGSGNWSVQFETVPGQGRSTVTATATDSVGNRSTAASRSVEVDTVAPPAPAIAVVSGDDKITAADLPGGIPVNGTAQSGSTVLVTWGNVIRETTASGGTWTVNFADAPSQGRSTISAVARDAAGNLSAADTRSVQADTTPPPGVPVISAVTGDNLVNAADADGGVVISGTATPNATVSVVWGTRTETDVAGSNGAWSVNFAENRVPADGIRPVTATATNSGGSSAAASVSVTIDTTAPGRPKIDDIEGNNRISEAEARDGVTISGDTEAGTTITVDWGGVTRTDTTTGSGTWSVTYATVPVGEGTSVVTASATDAAGNTGASRSQNVVVDPVSPSQTASIASVTDNVGPVTGSLPSGSVTDDTRPALVISLSSLLD